MTLTNHHVLVIGGSSGMGLATARRAAEQNAAVTITSTNADRLSAALKQLPAGTEGAVVDLTDGDSIARLFGDIDQLDHLVITAGDPVGPMPVASTAIPQLRTLLEVRFWGAVAAVQHAVPLISEGGSITLTSGTIAVRPGYGGSIASAGAAAVEGLVRGLAAELAPIRVNAVRPGAVWTPMWDMVPEDQREAALQNMASRSLTGTLGTPDEIAAAHLFLMENGFITGTVLTIDGGALLSG